MRRETVPGKSSAGFTLLEILLAIFILAIVMSTVYASYTGTLRIVEETRYSDYIYGMARNTMKRMIADMESISPYNGAFRFVSEENDMGEGDFTNLTFLTSAHLDFFEANSSGTAVVSYYVEEDEDKEGYLLKRSDILYRGGKEEEEEDLKGAGFVLCDSLKSVKYVFYDSEGEEYEDWDTSSPIKPGSEGAPTLISVDLEFTNPKDAENPFHFTTRVFVPMAGAR
ncbi:MAG: prepilin-type N-terminal cleavage/methylation domain-containing protein [Deltaproteobacteria bacterium]|nr:prepilin-type N-terminal cleavage/methylation domain-containing protein [Deltaproteobacteria bacterium]